jgi:hypothetical protein
MAMDMRHVRAQGTLMFVRANGGWVSGVGSGVVSIGVTGGMPK